jgi:hypothetical protein
MLRRNKNNKKELKEKQEGRTCPKEKCYCCCSTAMLAKVNEVEISGRLPTVYIDR